jgi:F0F1-type ATP synthase epsilon subunit
MASTSCTGNTVESGTSCTPTCSSDYKATGTFKCTNGVYTETAVCLEEGVTAVIEYFVEGKIQITITPPAGMTVDDLLKDQSFMNAVKASIAKGLDGVSPNDVTVVITKARRLLEVDAEDDSAARRLAAHEAALSVSYKIKTASKAAATALTNQITTQKAAFEETFKKTMKEEANVEVTGMVTETPAVSENYVADTSGVADGSGTSTGDDGGNTGAIVGGIIGGIAGVALLAFAFFWYSKKTGSQE